MNIVEVIERIRREGDTVLGGEFRSPRPLAANALAELQAASSLPEELATWLSYDASWLPLLESSAPSPRLAAVPMRSIFARWAGTGSTETETGTESKSKTETDAPPASGPDVWTPEQSIAMWIDFLPTPALADAPSIELPTWGSQDHILVIERDRVRVLGCEKRFEFWWKYSSFAAYLAHSFFDEEPPES